MLRFASQRDCDLDPKNLFNFGRGGEEIEHLQAAGIEVTVINGITAGLPAHTPVAIIRNASLPAQRHAATTLGLLRATIEQEQLPSPSVIVVGDVLQGLLAAGLDAAAGELRDFG